jgi:predicted metal-dependent phosphoesterase TrpH
MGPDLHIHSTASDGTLPPARIVERAAALGIPGIAITDHDSVAGVTEGLQAAERLGVRFISAVELSAGDAGRGMHVLGYFVDHTDSALERRLERLRATRLERAHRMVESLREGGYRIDIADVLLAADGGAVGRAHVAQTLVTSGHASSVTDAFERFLGRDKPFYVPKPVATPAEVIAWIHDAGGIAVLAHPAVSEIGDLVDGLVRLGLDGVEAFHIEHSAAEREYYALRAQDLGLVATGGSDFHGDERGTGVLGGANVPKWVLQELFARHARGARAS